MSHTDLGQPDLAALRAAAGDAEFAEAEAGLVSTCGYPLAGAGPLARDLARSLTEAGLPCTTALPMTRCTGSAESACCRYPPRPERARAGSRCRGPPTTCCCATSADTAPTRMPTRP